MWIKREREWERVRERGREEKRGKESKRERERVSGWVRSVCMCVRERGIESLCMCVWVTEREVFIVLSSDPDFHCRSKVTLYKTLTQKSCDVKFWEKDKKLKKNLFWVNKNQLEN